MITPESIRSGLDLLVREFVLLDHSTADGIGHPALSPPDNAAGHGNPNGGIMTQLRICEPKSAGKGPVFASRQVRNAPNAPIRRQGHSEARTGRFRMTRRWIVRLRVKQPSNIVEKSDEATFELIVGVEMLRNRCGFEGVDDGSATDKISAFMKPLDVTAHPVWRDNGVRIGCQEKALGPGERRRGVHREPSRVSRSAFFRGELEANNVEAVAQPGCESARDILCAITTIVEQQKDVIRETFLLLNRA
jgi:hypothetical protein